MKNLVLIGMLCAALFSCSKNATEGNPVQEIDEVPATDTITSNTRNFKGVNWADPRDNFADDWLVLSGLSTADDAATTEQKADAILASLQAQGINTVRLPVNPPTVLQSWWPKYALVIRKASLKGMKVIVAYWEGASSKDGIVDNLTSFWRMWDEVTTKFSKNGNVYFEVFNEPHGYNVTDLKSLYAEWLSKYPTIPRRRIVLDGAGYATDVNAIGADSRFDGCLLSFHFYTWFANRQTVADWEVPVQTLNYPERTVVTEFGVPMTNGKDYTGRPGSDAEVAYLQGMTNQLRERNIGNVYWPGIRTGDSYSMFSLNDNNIAVNNTSGFTRLKYAWGIGNMEPLYASFQSGKHYKIINRNSSKAVDVSGGATTDGSPIIQWEYNGNNNQLWQMDDAGNGLFSVANVNSQKVLSVSSASTAGGAPIVQWHNTAAAHQQWQVTDIGFGYYKIINKNSGQSLDVNGGATHNGGDIIQWHWNRGHNQQWKIELQ